MKLYLSSYKLGEDRKELIDLLPKRTKKVAIIMNALDQFPRGERFEQTKTEQSGWFEELGLQTEELDLRNYFGKEQELKDKLNEFGMAWVLGGNCFVLNRAFKYSGFGEALKEKINDNDFLYSGYSAGTVVLQPSLKGIQLVDDPNIVPEGYQDEVVWEGLGIIPYAIAPHFDSNHPESEAINNVILYYKENNIEYKTICDGEVIVECIG